MISTGILYLCDSIMIIKLIGFKLVVVFPGLEKFFEFFQSRRSSRVNRPGTQCVYGPLVFHFFTLESVQKATGLVSATGFTN